jgi:glycine cleavage system H protein
VAKFFVVCPLFLFVRTQFLKRKRGIKMGEWKTPDGYKYTETDDWIKLDGEEAQVGITDYAQDQLSDIVFVELPEVGDSFEAGEVYGVVESVKAAADLKLPVGGEIIAVNDALEDTPETINEDAFGAGWIARIKLADPSEPDKLMDAAAYAAYCDERG